MHVHETYQSINNDQHNFLCHEAWRLDLVATKSFTGKIHLVEVENLCEQLLNYTIAECWRQPKRERTQTIISSFWESISMWLTNVSGFFLMLLVDKYVCFFHSVYWANIVIVCLFCLGLSFHSIIFHSFGDLTIAGEGLLILTFARHVWPLSSEGSLACPIYCDTGHPFIMVISEDHWHSNIMPS